MKRILIALAVLIGSVLPASAQLTTMPIPLMQWLDNNADPLSAGGLCVFRAGTSALATTYTSSTGGVANANPVLFNSAGRATTGGVFLTPGESYKFVLVDFDGVGLPACVPNNGVTIWTVDNVNATPSSSVNIDVPGTAGEAMTAGKVAYISDGSGGLIAGRWYLATSLNAYSSTTPQIGFVVNDVAAAGAGSFRLVGRVTGLAGLATGSNYYIASSGGVTVAPPPLARLVGEADSSSSIVFGMPPVTTEAVIVTMIDARIKALMNGCVTLTSGDCSIRPNVSAATTIYWSPYNGNEIALYSGTGWVTFAQAELSIAVPATTNTGYDLFLDYNSGTPALSVNAWTNLTTRATALALQDGVYVLGGSTTQRYIGSFRTTAVSGQTESSLTKRWVWGYYNRADLELQVTDATASWTYTTATIRQANGAAGNKVEVFIGVQEEDIELLFIGAGSNSGGVSFAGGIGEDSTTTFARAGFAGAADKVSYSALLVKKPTIGQHAYSWNEWSAASSTTTFYGTSGDSTPAGVASGLFGRIKG